MGNPLNKFLQGRNKPQEPAKVQRNKRSREYDQSDEVIHSKR